MNALRRHRAAQNERRLLLGEAWHDIDLVVDRGDGEHLDPDTFSAGFRRAATAAGLEGARLHDLRHAYATTLLGAGVNVKVVSEALGHARTAFTMDVYAHVLPTMGEAGRGRDRDGFRVSLADMAAGCCHSCCQSRQ